MPADADTGAMGLEQREGKVREPLRKMRFDMKTEEALVQGIDFSIREPLH